MFWSIQDVYHYFDYFYPNRSIFRLIGAYSNKTFKCVDILHRNRISIKRIFSIVYLRDSKFFEVTYGKRHYGRFDVFYFRL